MLLIIAGLMTVFGTCFALTTIMERKTLGRMQNRFGPNRVGPFGLLQPMADGIKMLIKEDIVPFSADKTLHFLAPLALTVPVWLAFAVLPFGRNMSAIELDPAFSSFLPSVPRPNWRFLWPDGQVKINTRLWARCGRLHK
jgi:NADH-quinone oxidoreductase subunit H